MVDAGFIKGLKKSSVSVNAEKTKQRVGELFKAASASEKEEIEKLSGLGRSSIQKAYGTGGLSTKLAISMAHVLNVNPLYLSGDSDDKGTCSDEIIKSFLIGKDKSYEKLLGDTSPAKKPRAKAGKAAAPVPAADVTPPAPPPAKPPKPAAPVKRARKKVEKPVSAPKTKKAAATTPAPAAGSAAMESPKVEVAPLTPAPNKDFIDNMTEEQMILLMRAIILKAESGIPECVEQADRLKVLLASK